ncbi:DUF6427 family protein [Flavicella marina]|uniref:DUF6427 family protein n=1 Tax=Flavicella marina TaxID=1475951 RepID=UPI001D01E485|nr:DUF6427 family protein [Flavicella marina]
MLANFFEKTKPLNIIVLGLFFFSFSFTYFLTNKTTDYPIITCFFRTGIHAIFLLFSTIIFIKNGVSNNNLHNSFFIICFYGMFANALEETHLLYVSALFLWITQKIATLNNTESAKLTLFDIGILSGVSFLIYDWAILIMLFVYLSLIITQKVNLENILSPLLGLLVPLFLTFTYFFFIENVDAFYSFFDFAYNFDFSHYNSAHLQLSFYVLLFLTIVGIVVTTPKVISISDSYRLQYLLTILLLGISSVIISLKTEKNGNELLLTFAPLSIIMGRFVQSIPKKRFKELFVIAVFAFSLFQLLRTA